MMNRFRDKILVLGWLALQTASAFSVEPAATAVKPIPLPQSYGYYPTQWKMFPTEAERSAVAPTEGSTAAQPKAEIVTTEMLEPLGAPGPLKSEAIIRGRPPVDSRTGAYGGKREYPARSPVPIERSGFADSRRESRPVPRAWLEAPQPRNPAQ